MEKTIFILSILALLQFVFIISMVSTVAKLRSKIKSLEEEVEEYDEIIPGDKVTFESDLTYNKKSSFRVRYEADVTEVSEKAIKVTAYSVVGESLPTELTSQSNYKQVLLDFMKNKWVDREGVSVLLDKETIRNKKLTKILN